VAWMGGSGATRANVGGKEVTPMLYTRTQRRGHGNSSRAYLINVLAGGTGGGGTVAADSDGNVYVAWHASAPGNERGETGRAVFVSATPGMKAEPSNGKCAPTRNRRRLRLLRPMRAFADSSGRLYLAYRAANEISRDMTLLVSRDHGASFEMATIHNKWLIKGCPMSSCSFAEG